MKYFINRNYLRAAFTLLVLFIILISGVTPANAFQGKKADTVSTADVQFTTIPTAADSLAADRKSVV